MQAPQYAPLNHAEIIPDPGTPAEKDAGVLNKDDREQQRRSKQGKTAKQSRSTE